MKPTRQDRERWGRIGGLTTSSRHRGEDTTRAARQAFRERFERQVDEEAAARGETLEPAERARRAEAAMKVHMMRLAEKSAAARRKR